MELESLESETVIGSVGKTADGRDPDIVTLPDGRMLVVWSEVLVTPTDSFTDLNGAIFARYLKADGTPDGEAFQVNAWEPAVQSAPKVTVLGNGSVVIGWSSEITYGDDPVDRDVFFQIYDDEGDPLREQPFDAILDNPPFVQELVDLVSLTANRLAVLFSDG